MPWVLLAQVPGCARQPAKDNHPSGDTPAAPVEHEPIRPPQPEPADSGATASAKLPQKLTYVLLSEHGEVLVQRTDGSWRQPSRRDILQPQDTVRTGRTDSTRIQLADRLGITLQRNSELTLAANKSGDEITARYLLASGSALFELEPTNGISHVVEVAGQRLELDAGEQQAKVEVSTSGSGRTQLKVRRGKVHFGDKQVLEAGWRINLAPGREPEAPLQLAQTYVSLTADSQASVFYANTVPPVRFRWSTSTQGPWLFELAKDAAYKHLLAKEELSHPELLLDELTPGDYHWRVGKQDSWSEGSLSIEKYPDEACKSCKQSNLIDDTGESAVVYFRGALPAITFRWTATPGAANYRLKVFVDGAFDTPLVDETVTDTTATFAPGRFPESKYFWLVTALDQGGSDIGSGKMNSLRISHDDAAAHITIRTPKDGARVGKKSVVTAGEVHPGEQLYINGKTAKVDNHGRFSERIVLADGDNQIVFRAVAKSGEEYFYLRALYRR